MKINLFLFNFIFCCTIFLAAQQKDSVYYVQFISNDTKEGIPFANVTAESNGVKIAAWTSDLDGVVKILGKQISGNTNVQIKAQQVGYKAISFPSLALRLNDTLVMALQNNQNELSEIVIVTYKEPLIDSDTKTSDKKRRHKKSEPEIKEPEKPVSIYSQQQLDDYDSLKNGRCIRRDTLPRMGISFADFYRYLSKSIRYPQIAIDNNIEGVVYMQFTLDEKGYVQNIKVLKGDVILSLEVAKVLSSITRIIPEQFYEGDSNHTNAPAEFTLPVRFVLQ